MITSRVPSEATKVEQSIIASFSIEQSSVIGVGMFISFAIFLYMPPIEVLNNTKLAIVLCIMLFAGILVVKIKRRTIYNWIKLYVQYMIRPSYHVIDLKKENGRVKNWDTKSKKKPVSKEDDKKETKHHGDIELSFDRKDITFTRDRKGNMIYEVK